MSLVQSTEYQVQGTGSTLLSVEVFPSASKKKLKVIDMSTMLEDTF